jgi:hypothetical protein
MVVMVVVPLPLPVFMIVPELSALSIKIPPELSASRVRFPPDVIFPFAVSSVVAELFNLISPALENAPLSTVVPPPNARVKSTANNPVKSAAPTARLEEVRLAPSTELVTVPVVRVSVPIESGSPPRSRVPPFMVRSPAILPPGPNLSVPAVTVVNPL